MEPQISILRREATEFAARGGNKTLFWTGETLFWAGCMSELVGQLLRTPIHSSGEIAKLLDEVKREYDGKIFSSANAKPEKKKEKRNYITNINVNSYE